jgi:hypothetical protein
MGPGGPGYHMQKYVSEFCMRYPGLFLWKNICKKIAQNQKVRKLPEPYTTEKRT